jgi:hypothetical protein
MRDPQRQLSEDGKEFWIFYTPKPLNEVSEV